MSSDIESRLHGTRWSRIAQELFTNSAQFPIANILLELLIEGPFTYVIEPDFYAITAAGMIQAYFLGSWQYIGKPLPLVGNLIGPTLYTIAEAAIEGGFYFFANPIHLAYWGFSLAIGLLQQSRLRAPVKVEGLLILLENFVRTNILLAGYWIFEALTEPRFATLEGFFSDPSHVFVVTIIPLIGLLVGFANITAYSYLAILRQTAAQLKLYSEWLLGRDLLSQAVADPASLTLQRRERAVLFMDIRGFTQWSESQPPERLVAMLNAYYEGAERVWSRFGAIKAKLTADEVMVVFPTAESAAQAAIALRLEMGPMLSRHGLAAGTGIHSGPLVEGLLGSKEIKGYDVIGDTVNTAKRLCETAAGEEILISESICAALGKRAAVLDPRNITVKGKSEPIMVYPLQEFRTGIGETRESL